MSPSDNFSRFGVLSIDGRCKSFDADADSYCRGEVISVVYLQKFKDAKQIYATFVHGEINFGGFKEQGITLPSTTMQSRLLGEFYEECGARPTMTSFIEAHGTGITIGDPNELKVVLANTVHVRTSPNRIIPNDCVFPKMTVV